MSRKIEWSTLRTALGVFFICLLLSAALLWVSYLFRDGMKKEHEENQIAFRDISAKYLSVDSDEKIIKELYPKFIELYNRGIIGSEKRLNWIETLQNAGYDIQLPALKYQIDSREPYQPEYEIDKGAYELYATKMKLNLGLLHEVDLAKLINSLNKGASGLYNIKSCNFKITGTGILLDAEKANINTECELQWYSLNLAGDKELKL